MAIGIVLAYGINPNGTLPVLAKNRVDKAAQYFNERRMDFLILSGAASFYGGDRSMTEASAMQKLAVQLGVTPNYIVLDEESDDTYSQAENTLWLYRDHRFNLNEVVYVFTSELQLARAKLAFKRRWSKAEFNNIRFIAISDSQDVSKMEFAKRNLDELVKLVLMLDERVYNFARKTAEKWAELRHGH